METIDLKQNKENNEIKNGKTNGKRKKIFITIISILLFFCVISIMMAVFSKEVESFKKPKQTSYSLYEKADLSFKVYASPKGLSEDEFKIENTNDSAVDIKEVSFKDEKDYTAINFSLKAKTEGKSKIKISSSKNEDIKCEDINFVIKEKPVVKSIEIDKDWFEEEVGKTQKYTAYIETKNLKRNQIKVKIGNKKIVSIKEISFKTKDDKTVFVFKLKAKKKGKTILLISSLNGKVSDKIEIKVKEKDTSRIVYVTPYGEKYHFSKSCAGKNASKTTLNNAKTYKDPCKKCTY